MTAPAIPDGLEPLAVWDVRSDAWFDRYFLERAKWATGHIERSCDTYRAEFYLLDAPFARLHCYRRNPDGFKHGDPATGEPVTEPPVIVPLAELPPAHLLRG